MCWISEKKPVPHLAEDDIPVFKLCTKSTDGLVYPYYFGRRMTYKVGGYYTSNIHTKKVLMAWNNTYEIDEGLHSYSPKCTLSQVDGCKISVYSPLSKNVGEYYTYGLCIMLCLIPKGSTYYLNDKYEYVSDAIKVVRIIDHRLLDDITYCNDLDRKTAPNRILNNWIHKEIEI